MKNLFIVFILISHQAIGQKTLEAYKTTQSIEIDGLPDEADWAKAMIATDFFTIDPVPGLKPKQKTKVRMLYDDTAIYVCAEMEEVARDSIMTELSIRDNLANTDAFGILLDTYNNGTDGIILVVASTGVQYDAIKSNDGDEDESWDAVWESDVHLTEEGWTCEMRIPYSAIRFPKTKIQTWTLNFIRSQQRLGQTSTWTNIDPKIDGVFTQSGQLTNIQDIEPPLRLSFTPYLTTYATHYHDKEAAVINSTGYSYSAGMDVKYGLNDAFTLDMTLVPDFGQVEADDLVVNLSPFEVELSEKRPFFTEGLELFSKADIFYTRRIGGTALNYYEVEDGVSQNEEIESNPQIPQLYNATKISGRTTGGLGIGFFNAVEAPTEATISAEGADPRVVKTQPLTNYNVVVLDQNLKNNSNIALINTNVWRKGAEFYDANVIATEFNLKDKNQKYSLNGQAAYSNQMFSDSPNNTGHSFELNVEKISGNVNLYTGYEEISRNYDHNDLGFLNNANERSAEIGIEYSFFKPVLVFNRLNLWLDIENSYLYDPSVYTNTHFNWGFWGQTKKLWNINMWFNYSTDKKDYFEPRTEDFSRYVVRPAFYNAGIWLGTDSRKKFRLTINGNLYNLNEENRWGYFYAFSPRYRFSDKLSMNLSYNYNIQYDDTGWIADGDSGEIYLGQRDVRNITSLINMSYIFNSKMGINLRTRHDWFVAAYNTYHLLGPKGELLDTDYRDDLDFSNSFFSVDFGFTWRFAPGSDLNVVWKNNINGDKTDPSLNYRDRSYINGVSALKDFPQQNSLSIRFTYFIDQLDISRKFGNTG